MTEQALTCAALLQALEPVLASGASVDVVTSLRAAAVHAAAVLDAVGGESDGAEQAAPAPPLEEVHDAALLLELLLEPSHRIYLVTAELDCLDSGAAAGGVSVVAEGGWVPPLLREVIDAFASAGGYGIAARALSSPDALPLGTSAILLRALSRSCDALHRPFAAPVCSALATATCAALLSSSDARLSSGLDRLLIGHLLASLHALQLRVEVMRGSDSDSNGAAAAAAAPGEADATAQAAAERAAGERVETVALRLALRCVRTPRMVWRLLGISLLCELWRSATSGNRAAGERRGGAADVGDGAEASSLYRHRGDSRGEGSAGLGCGAEAEAIGSEWRPFGWLRRGAISTEIREASYARRRREESVKRGGGTGAHHTHRSSEQTEPPWHALLWRCLVDLTRWLSLPSPLCRCPPRLWQAVVAAGGGRRP